MDLLWDVLDEVVAVLWNAVRNPKVLLWLLLVGAVVFYLAVAT